MRPIYLLLKAFIVGDRFNNPVGSKEFSYCQKHRSKKIIIIINPGNNDVPNSRLLPVVHTTYKYNVRVGGQRAINANS